MERDHIGFSMKIEDVKGELKEKQDGRIQEEEEGEEKE
jgi:hypothetical protein